jgi:hypothetical protein
MAARLALQKFFKSKGPSNPVPRLSMVFSKHIANQQKRLKYEEGFS